MTNFPSVSEGTVRIVHIVDGDHHMRAELANLVVESGGHAEIYENMDELLAARPVGGVILTCSASGCASNMLSRLHSRRLNLPLVLFAEAPRPSDIVRAAHHGAADFLKWPFTADELKASCTYCQAFMSERGDTILRQNQSRELVAKLSPREQQILIFMLQGLSNKSMANMLRLSPRTVEDYRLNAMRKLGVNVTSAAIRIGLEAGLQNTDPDAGLVTVSDLSEEISPSRQLSSMPEMPPRNEQAYRCQS